MSCFVRCEKCVEIRKRQFLDCHRDHTRSTTTMTNGMPLSLTLGPERKIYLHASDPSEHPGLRFEHSSVDGRVRVIVDDYVSTHHTGDDSDGRRSPPLTVEARYNGIIEGDVKHDDIVREVAGIDARRPISEHMWKLTLGLMRVAPRPIEVIIASERDPTSPSEEDDEEEEVEERLMTAISNKASGYMQLDMTGEVILSPHDDEEEIDDSHKILHDPWKDEGRFGPERRVVFHEMSLGVKLQRIPDEGIVRVQKVMSSIIEETQSSSSPGVRVPPSPDEVCPDGEVRGGIEPGDTVFEVGGVDLRNKVIGILEWADMVHFIKHVGRPLEMVVAKDSTFVYDVQKESEHMENQKLEDMEQGAKDGSLNNAFCFNLGTDEVCNIPCTVPCTVPCGGGFSGGIDTRMYGALAELGAPISSTGGLEVPGLDCGGRQGRYPWEMETQDADDEDSVNATSSIVDNGNDMKNLPIDTLETDADRLMAKFLSRNTELKSAVGLPPTLYPKVSGFNSRTHPQNGSSALTKLHIDPKPSKCVTSSQKDGDAGSVGEDSVDSTPLASVSRLKEMFSPIKTDVGEEGIKPSDLSTPTLIEKDKMRLDHQSAVSNATKLNGLFSPMANPESPTSIVPQSPDVTGDGVSFLTEASPNNTTKRSPVLDKLMELGRARKFKSGGVTGSPLGLNAEQQRFTSSLDSTNDSSFHQKFVDNLIDEFCSPNHPPRQSLIGFVDNLRDDACTPMESRDEVNNRRDKKSRVPLSAAMAKAFDSDSPFVGNINFSTPHQRVPSSALFAQAFVVQPNLEGGSDTRWVQTQSPLFVKRKALAPSQRTQPFEPFTNSPGTNTESFTAIDFAHLKWGDMSGKALADATGSEEEENPSFDEIPYTNTPQCCSIGDVFGEFAQNCGLDLLNSSLQQQQAEVNCLSPRLTSPRRKTLFSKIRKKTKKNAYERANTGDDDDSDGPYDELMKGVRPAHVQLAYQNIRGKSIARATQFTPLVEDEVCF